MILLQLNHVARYFAEVKLYNDVSFNIQTNDRIALVGRNGTGKSTLIKQIMGLEPISEGEITKVRDLTIGYLEQHVSVDSPLSVWEEMLTVFKETLALRDLAAKSAQEVADLATDTESLAYQDALRNYDRLQVKLDEENAYSVESDIRTVLHGLRFYPEDYDLPVQALSGGQKTRLALAKILLMNYDVLILDEPTNHLDMETLNWLEGYLQSYRGALLIVSHDRYFLNKLCNQVVELRNGTSHIYKGNYSYYLKEKEARLQAEWKAYEEQQEEIESLEDFIQRNIARASTTKRAQSRRKKLERMEKIEKPLGDEKSPRIQFSTSTPSGQQVLQVHDLAIGYPDQDGALAENINMDLRRQEAIAIVGPNGIGKTTYLKTLIGELPPKAGEISFGTNVDIGYYDQNVNQLDPKLTVLETLWRAHDYQDEWKVRSILGSFLFTGEDVEKTVGMLSGGEKARLALALLATEHDNTLLLDEPTNHLDIDSKEVLEDALIDYNGTLLFVSHDRYFINRIASQILEITPDGSMLYLGDYDYYLEKKAELEAIEAMQEKEEEEQTPEISDLQRSYQENKQMRNQIRRLEQAIQESEEKLQAAEEEERQLYEDLVVASEANDQGELSALHARLLEVQDKQNILMEEWEELNLQLEAYQS